MTLIKELFKMIGLFLLAFLLHNFLYYFGVGDFFRTVVCVIAACISIKVAWFVCEVLFSKKEWILQGITYGWLFIVMPALLLGRYFMQWLDTWL